MSKQTSKRNQETTRAILSEEECDYVAEAAVDSLLTSASFRLPINLEWGGSAGAGLGLNMYIRVNNSNIMQRSRNVKDNNGSSMYQFLRWI